MAQFKNFFSQEEILQIKKSIDEEMKTRITTNNEDYTFVDSNHIVEQKYLGRVVMQQVNLPQNIIKKVDEYANKIWSFDDECIRSGITYNLWSKKYGSPNLNPHLDNNNLGLVLDYQLDANIIWPLNVEETKYLMDNNDMVDFIPTSEYHWRDNIDFKDGDYVGLLFFEYAGENIKAKIDKEKQDSLIKIWREKRNYEV